MNFPFLIAGLILLLAGQSWFAGAATVGWICLAVGVIPIVFVLLLLILGATTVGLGSLFGRRR